jgi:hypothetical protein
VSLQIFWRWLEHITSTPLITCDLKTIVYFTFMRCSLSSKVIKKLNSYKKWLPLFLTLQFPHQPLFILLFSIQCLSTISILRCNISMQILGNTTSFAQPYYE